MASIAAANVAREVLETVRQGKRPILTQIAVRNGYTVNSANASRPQKTATYKAIMSPAIKSMEAIRAKTLKEMESRDMSLEELGTLSTVLKNLTHDIQVLSGGSTSEHNTHDKDRAILIQIVQSLHSDSDTKA